ncbi:uncharacterized protein LOC114711544 [Neltuma alba]|uniref:uncharacterized protein LOC114711544 n=1 Tax=Neltuma alba TaxID=207710 RepID=UPI0010A58A02|nr:uncharacterized protein LOC114711544 [Prosopis alba]
MEELLVQIRRELDIDVSDVGDTSIKVEYKEGSLGEKDEAGASCTGFSEGDDMVVDPFVERVMRIRGNTRNLSHSFVKTRTLFYLTPSPSSLHWKFLSHRFGPHNLIPEDAPLLLEPHHNGLSISEESHDFANGYTVNEELKIVALEATNKSHAPYCECLSTVALMDGSGKIYKWSYMESTAFNPSMRPM